MSDVPDFQDLIVPLEDPNYPKWDIPFLIAQRLMDRLKAIEAKVDALGADYFTFKKDSFHPTDPEPWAYPPPEPCQGTVYTGLVVDPHAMGHTPPVARADLRGFPIASEADCLSKDPPAPKEPE